MTDRWKPSRRLWLALVLVLALGAFATALPMARAQTIKAAPPPAPPPPMAVPPGVAPVLQFGAPVSIVYSMSEATFNQMVYGNMPPAMIRAQAERKLMQKIAAIDQACNLSPAQKEILELAGKGEMKRRFDHIEDQKGVIGRELDREAYVKVTQDLRTLAQTVSAEPFGDGSLFAKALKSSLAEDQTARLGQVVHTEDLERYTTRVDAYISLLAHSLALSDAQRRQLRSLLLQQTRPPRKFGPYDLLIVQYHLSHIPEERLKPIFDAAQWGMLKRRFEESKASEQVLENGGFLRDGPVAGTAGQASQPAVRNNFTER